MNLGSIVNSTAEDAMGSISADGTTLYFMSDRLGGQGDFDIWVTTVVPEPSTLLMAIAGFVVVLAYYGLIRHRKSVELSMCK